MEPLLLHIPTSHYSEKVRWALDLKAVPHRRAAPRPPARLALPLALTRGRRSTYPVLRIDGRALADSTEIIATLEQRWPDPPLYPEDPVLHARALALEDWFDEQAGPYTRLAPDLELTDRPRVVAAFAKVEAELDGGDYLAGDAFTVADLTAAALLYPIVLPQQAPAVADEMPEPFVAFRDSLRGRLAFAWVEEMYRRHRHRHRHG